MDLIVYPDYVDNEALANFDLATSFSGGLLLYMLLKETTTIKNDARDFVWKYVRFLGMCDFVLELLFTLRIARLMESLNKG